MKYYYNSKQTARITSSVLMRWRNTAHASWKKRSSGCGEAFSPWRPRRLQQRTRPRRSWCEGRRGAPLWWAAHRAISISRARSSACRQSGGWSWQDRKAGVRVRIIRTMLRRGVPRALYGDWGEDVERDAFCNIVGVDKNEFGWYP